MKFYGKVGYSTGDDVETAPGVWDKVIIEKTYYGDVLRNSRQLQDDAKVNSDIGVNNTISVVADAYALVNFFAIQYIEWSGTKWIVSDVQVQSPRLILRLGGIYNGPTP